MEDSTDLLAEFNMLNDLDGGESAQMKLHKFKLPLKLDMQWTKGHSALSGSVGIDLQ